jgi:hypothetical protein
MTSDDEIERLRKACNDVPPRTAGRRVTIDLDPKIVLKLLDDLKSINVQLQDTQAAYGMVVYERDAMKPVVEALDQHERRYQTAGTLRDAIRTYRATMERALIARVEKVR